MLETARPQPSSLFVSSLRGLAPTQGMGWYACVVWVSQLKLRSISVAMRAIV